MFGESLQNAQCNQLDFFPVAGEIWENSRLTRFVLKFPWNFFSLKITFAGLCEPSLTHYHPSENQGGIQEGVRNASESSLSLGSLPCKFKCFTFQTPPLCRGRFLLAPQKFPQAESLTGFHLSGFLSYPGYYPIAENRYVLYFV